MSFMSSTHRLMMQQEGDVNMIADIGSFAAAAVHPSMVAPAAPTNDKTLDFLNSFDVAAPSVAPRAGL